VQVGRSPAALAAAAQDFHIVDKIAFCHNCLSYFPQRYYFFT
jgi:hypothetical protein